MQTDTIQNRITKYGVVQNSYISKNSGTANNTYRLERFIACQSN